MQKCDLKVEKMRKEELEEIRVLQEAVLDWTKAQDIRRFADHLENKIINIVDVSEREQLIKLLEWARDKADWLDPLTEKNINRKVQFALLGIILTVI